MPDEPALPHIGRLLRKLRLERGLSRERLAFAAGVSTSYITHLEAGKRNRPTAAVMTALVRHLEKLEPLTEAQVRQLNDLSGRITRPVPTLAELRAEVTAVTGELLASFGVVPACCVDIGWNLLACNDSYAAAFPGMVTDGNVLRCLFADPMSTQILVDWQAEAEQAVRLLRGRLAQHADLPWCTELLAELSRFPKFRRIWDKGEVSYHRELGPAQLRDPVTDRRSQVYLQSFRLAAGVHYDRVQIHLFVPVT
ncbi:MmyB family transcriptional regulator [Nocardia inohanensis]|uniref:MmyB family transcriptional regulator n=1 Tax=Nocardia inohanensis TaxID=209246 RepID=UPI000A6BE650|nr:helix-turn-helix domain-containing protein [Nocardia inohanensis]